MKSSQHQQDNYDFQESAFRSQLTFGIREKFTENLNEIYKQNCQDYGITPNQSISDQFIKNDGDILKLNLTSDISSRDLQSICLTLENSQKDIYVHFLDIQLTEVDINSICDLIKKNNQIRQIVLKNNGINRYGVTHLESAFNSINNRITDFQCHQNPITSSGATNILKSFRNSNNIEYIALTYAEIDDTITNILIDFIKSQNSLKNINLEGNKFSARAFLQLTEAVQTQPKIQGLNMSYNPIGNEVMQNTDNYLKKFPEIILKGIKLQVSGIELFSKTCNRLNTLQLDQVQTINFSQNRIANQGVLILINCLNNFKHLKNLQLNDNKIGGSITKQLYEYIISPINKLEKIGLEKNLFSGKDAATIANVFQRNYSLKELDLRKNFIEPNEIDSITSQLYRYNAQNKMLISDQLTRKSTLPVPIEENFFNNQEQKLDQFNEAWYNYCSVCSSRGLSINPNIQEIRDRLFRDTNTEKGNDDDTITELIFDKGNSSLNNTDIQFMETFMKLIETVTTIRIENQLIDSVELKNILEALQQCQYLKKIVFKKTSLNQNAADQLINFLKKHPTKEQIDLQLDYNNLGNEGFQVIYEYICTYNPKITGIKLPYNNINFQGLQKFQSSARSGQLQKLSELNLDGNKIGEEGIHYLINSLDYLPNLRLLSLGNCGLTEQIAPLLSDKIKIMKNLQLLKIDNNDLYDGGAKQLIPGLKANTSLVLLNIKKNGLSSQLVNEYKQQLKIHPTLREVHIDSLKKVENGLTKPPLITLHGHSLYESQLESIQQKPINLYKSSIVNNNINTNLYTNPDYDRRPSSLDTLQKYNNNNSSSYISGTQLHETTYNKQMGTEISSIYTSSKPYSYSISNYPSISSSITDDKKNFPLRQQSPYSNYVPNSLNFETNNTNTSNNNNRLAASKSQSTLPTYQNYDSKLTPINSLIQKYNKSKFDIDLPPSSQQSSTQYNSIKFKEEKENKQNLSSYSPIYQINELKSTNNILNQSPKSSINTKLIFSPKQLISDQKSTDNLTRTTTFQNIQASPIKYYYQSPPRNETNITKDSIKTTSILRDFGIDDYSSFNLEEINKLLNQTNKLIVEALRKKRDLVQAKQDKIKNDSENGVGSNFDQNNYTLTQRKFQRGKGKGTIDLSNIKTFINSVVKGNDQSDSLFRNQQLIYDKNDQVINLEVDNQQYLIKLKAIDDKLLLLNQELDDIVKELEGVESTLKSLLMTKDQANIQKAEPIYQTKKIIEEKLRNKVDERKRIKDEKLFLLRNIVSNLIKQKNYKEQKMVNYNMIFGGNKRRMSVNMTLLEDYLKTEDDRFSQQQEQQREFNEWMDDTLEREALLTIFVDSLDRLYELESNKSQINREEQVLAGSLNDITTKIDNLMKEVEGLQHEETEILDKFIKIGKKKATLIKEEEFLQEKLYIPKMSTQELLETKSRTSDKINQLRPIIQEEMKLRNELKLDNENIIRYAQQIKEIENEIEKRKKLLETLEKCSVLKEDIDKNNIYIFVKIELTRQIDVKIANLNEEKRQFEEDLETIIKVTDLDEYKKIENILQQNENNLIYLGNKKNEFLNEIEKTGKELEKFIGLMQNEDILSEMFTNQWKKIRNFNFMKNALARKFKMMGILN